MSPSNSLNPPTKEKERMSSIRKLKYLLLVSVFALSLGLAACSSDDSGDDSTSGDTSASGDLIQ
jgi:hypothetical protein